MHPISIADHRSPEAVARAAANSRKYSLSAKDLIVANPEEEAEFNEMLELHLAQLIPNGSVEHTIFDEMIAAAWNLRRMRRLETALCKHLDPVAALDKLDRIAKHQTRLERSYYKALNQLAAIQTERVLRRTHADAKAMIDYSPLFNSREVRKPVFSKRTQPSPVRQVGNLQPIVNRPPFPLET
jgi:hypothetical protein